jgi:Fuc2NAc and GlcNAc transferase
MPVQPSVYACAAICLLVASVALTWWVRRIALHNGIIDRPNARSSHSMPVPRGGGLAIVVLTSLGIAAAAITGAVDHPLAVALVAGGIPIAWIGFKDDRQPVPVAARLSIHATSAICVMYVLGGLPAIQVGHRLVDLGLVGDVLGVIAIVWAVNLFNFMDGIDGIAASEAIFIALGGGALCALGAAPMSVPVAGAALAATCAGFLLWNWPPARIFMGDVGSGYLGYVIAVLALAAAREQPVAIFAWLILGAVFFIDATVTLVRRLIRGERAYEAHCSHAYQILARRWGSHRSVTLTVLLVNVLILWPAAWLTIRHPWWAGWIAVVVLMSLGIVVAAVGAGKGEDGVLRQL